MLKRTIKYEDYNGEMREEDFYFNLNQSEVIKWLTQSGSYTLDKVMERLAQERNGRKIMEIFEDLIHRAYGRKSLDGRKFEKNEEIWLDFYQTEAYSKLFTELVSDAKKAADFVNAIVPREMAEEVEKAIAANPDGIPAELRDYVQPQDKQLHVVAESEAKDSNS